RRLMDARVDCLVVEARPRLGGRAWTMHGNFAFPIDLGCGWLHSADPNPRRDIAEAQGCSISTTQPPWTRRPAPNAFPPAEQTSLLQAVQKVYQELDSVPEQAREVAVGTFPERHGPWNALINAVSTYANGAELDRVSARDVSRYDDSGVNWRVVE